MADATKVCSLCGVRKSISAFHVRKKSRDGLRSCCKSCQRRRYYLANKQEYLRRNRQRKELIRQLIIEAKTRPCEDCGRSFSYWIMQFDHLSNKSFSIGKSATNKSLKQVEQEIVKCQVVCSNCHADRTHRRRLAAKAGAIPALNDS